MVKKILFPLTLLLILGIGLIVSSILLKQPQDIRERATTGPTITINDFKTSYSTMLKYYKQQRKIQIFGGGLVLAEFDDGTGNIYAGHLGSFWAPPFFSSNVTASKTDDWTKSFAHGLVFYNNGYGAGTAEKPTDLATETADWYPSKTIVSHFYPGGGGGSDIKAVRVALPATRGLALKLTTTNKTPTSQSYNTLFLMQLPTIKKLTNWQSPNMGWNWMLDNSVYDTLPTQATFDKSNNLAIIRNTDATNPIFMAVGLSGYLNSWGLDNKLDSLYNDFLYVRGGTLANVNKDTPDAGSAVGLVAGLPTLNPNQSVTVTLIIGIGETEAKAKEIVLNYRNKDVEAEADNFWNSRLKQIFNNLPDLQTGNPTLNKIYRNAILSYLVNRWDIFNAISEAAGFGQSISLFPWFTGTTQILALADPPFWKIQLTRLLSLDYSNCRAYETVIGKHLCDTTYSYSPYALVEAIYEYVTLTNDYAFLDANYTTLRNLILADDNRADTDGLVNFGNDYNLYEYNIRCNLGGNYTGKVLGPNADRIVAHRYLAEMAQKLGKPQNQITYHQNKIAEIKNAIQKLWRPSDKTFASISYYQADNTLRPTPQTVIFKTVLPNLLLQYDDILTPEQMTALTSDLTNATSGFAGGFGLTSLPIENKDTWCAREDWQGPGLYSGAVGAILTGLFKQGYQNIAYNLLTMAESTDYDYLANIPYFSQAFPWDKASTTLAEGYLEGVSLAQAIIKGMFGVETNSNHTKIAPHIPTALLNYGPVSLVGLKTQGHLWDVKVSSATDQQLILEVDQISNPGSDVDHFRFGYEMNGTLTITVQNLLPNKSFKIVGTPLDGGTPFTVYATSNANGTLTKNLTMNGNYLIVGTLGSPTATPTPSPTPKPTPSPSPSPSATPTLNVSLSANPAAGNPPLTGVDFTAVVTGNATGAIRYRFDCTDDGTWEVDVPNQTSTNYTAQNACTYITIGSYTAKVRVDRSGVFATDTAAITVVNPPPSPSPTLQPTPSPSLQPTPSPSPPMSPTPPQTSPSPPPQYTVNDLKNLLLNFLGTNDTNYQPSEGKINLLDASWVIRWLK